MNTQQSPVRSSLLWFRLAIVFTISTWGANFVLGILLFLGYFRGNALLANILGPTLAALAAWSFAFVSSIVNHKGSHGHWPNRHDWHDIAGRSWRLVLVVLASMLGPILGVLIRNWYIASLRAATNDAAIAIVYIVPSVLISRVILYVTQAWVFGYKTRVVNYKKKTKASYEKTNEKRSLRQKAAIAARVRGKRKGRARSQRGASVAVWALRLLFVIALAAIFALWIPVTFFRVGAVEGQAADPLIRILEGGDLVVTGCITIVVTIIASFVNARTRGLKGNLFSWRITRRDGKFASKTLKQVLISVVRTEISYFLGFDVGGEYSLLFPREPALTSDIISWVQQLVSSAMDLFRVHLNGRDSGIR